MTEARNSLTNPGRKIPDFAFATRSGAPRRLRSGGRRSPVLVLVHPGACEACAAFIQRLGAASAALNDWDGDVLVITPETPDEPGSASSDHVPVLSDPEQRLAESLSITPPAVVIADQWGEVHEITEARAEHRFPSAEEIESWLRYLAIQCPECQGEAL
ncbi:MAG TPA: redoxin domain-containing protein [Longimicrobium sp.]|nr:redoxin domain-containing protein [Longimicrobium sp.]